MLAFIHHHIVESIRFTLPVPTIEHIGFARVSFFAAAIFIRHIFHSFFHRYHETIETNTFHFRTMLIRF